MRSSSSILYKEKGKNTTEFKTVATFNKMFQVFSIIKIKINQ